MTRDKNYYIYQIWELIRGTIGDDDNLDERLISAWIDNGRALWLANNLNKFNWVDPTLTQDVNSGSVTIETVDAGVVGLPVDTPIKRTTINIPKPVVMHRQLAFSRIGSVDKTVPEFKIIDILQVPSVGNGRFNKDAIYAFWYDDKVYIYCNNTENIDYKLLKKVSVRAMFESPEDVPGFEEGDTYPISDGMFAYIKNYILEKNYKAVLTAPTDEINNARDDK